MMQEQMNWEALSAKTRRGIRHAEKSGVMIHQGRRRAGTLCGSYEANRTAQENPSAGAAYFQRLVSLYGNARY